MENKSTLEYLLRISKQLKIKHIKPLIEEYNHELSKTKQHKYLVSSQYEAYTICKIKQKYLINLGVKGLVDYTRDNFKR